MIKRIYKAKMRSPKRYRPEFKLCDMKWEFHPFDKDPWPSIPHGHTYEEKRAYKLDVWTGIVYDRATRKRVGKVKRKYLQVLWNTPEFKEVVERENDFHGIRRLNYSVRRNHLIADMPSNEGFRFTLPVSLF